MKKILSVLFVICLMCSLAFISVADGLLPGVAQSVWHIPYLTNINTVAIRTVTMAFVQGTITTPSGTTVAVEIAIRDIDDDHGIIPIIPRMAALNEIEYPNAELVSAATATYNCHAYAWHMWNGGSACWLNDPTPYIADGSYVETSDPGYGDIICYYTSGGTLLHSGIVLSRGAGTSNGVCGNADLMVVRSKWHYDGLYDHAGDDCKYVREDGASYVRYYTRHTNHTYTYAPSNIDYHTKACTECAYDEQEAHTWATYGTKYRCTVCGYVSSFLPVEINSLPSEIFEKLMTYTNLANGDVIFIDGMQFCYMDGQLYQVVEYSPDVVTPPSEIG